MYRRFLSLVLVLWSSCWLAFGAGASEPAPAPVKKIKTGFYVDKGSAGGAVLRRRCRRRPSSCRTTRR